MNHANFKTVLDHIKAYPDTWRQSDYWNSTLHCGCFLAWARMLSGSDYGGGYRWLELTQREHSWIYDYRRTLADFDAFLTHGGIPPDSDTVLLDECLVPSDHT
jgi:hypothetical protein